MAPERWVLLGLAQPRAGWFRDVAQWTTSASLAAEFVKCLSAEEVRVRLASGRPHSALLIDVGLPAFDRDLVAAAVAAAVPVIAVSDPRRAPSSVSDLGVAAVLPHGFARDELVTLLEAHARLIGRVDQPPVLDDPVAGPWRGRLVAVCGPGGTGTSTIAIAAAQAAGADVRTAAGVLLADLARRADQAMLHDARDLGPGLQELVEAYRTGRPGPETVTAMTFDTPRRGYRLLLGLRRPSAWAALRPRATDAALDGLRAAFQVVVADVTGDLEGEADGGSEDVEERNHLARTTLRHADVVLVVGAPGLKGVHSLAGLVRAVADLGIDPHRILAVVNRGPRSPRARAEVSAALAGLTGRLETPGPVWVPERQLDDALIDGAPLPSAVVGPVAAALAAVAERTADTPPTLVAPEPVRPGSLGTWTGS